MLSRGLKSSNWAVRERMWIVAERRKGEVCFDSLNELDGSEWIIGTGMVMLRPARAEESSGFPAIEALWNKAVTFGDFPTIKFKIGIMNT